MKLSEDKLKKIEKIYRDYCLKALNIDDMAPWTTKLTITDKVLSPSTERNRKVLRACDEAIARGAIGGIQEGDKVWVYQYIAGKKQQIVKGEPVVLKSGEPKLVDDNQLRFVELFDGDYDKWHYVKRVYNTLEILENVLDFDHFDKYHLKSKRKLLDEKSL